ncbi:GAF and ANTAR domain-containing protein [Mycetocola sp. 2940]|uniref:GAF and ANTAR domain-containing protein n=1 Tax=Mycetocola sp. 2940 TaxID=3156452 RepID=UPI00339917DD
MNAAQAVADVGPKLAAPFLDLLPITGVAISVFSRDQRALIIHASDDTAAELEETHLNLGEGPLFDCFKSAQPISVPDVAATERWPLFISHARGMGVAAVFLFPLTLGAACVGAALCYRSTAGPLDSEASDVGSALGRAIAGQALRRALQLAEGEDPDEASPIEMRREVHQATGMVLSQMDTTASDALALMRAYAFSHGVNLREVARAVVTRQLDFSTSRD